MATSPTISSHLEPRPGVAYELRTQWQFDAPLPVVWSAIVDCATWPAWWPGIECVATLHGGDAAGLGAVRRFRCKGALPYRLSFVSRITRIEPLRLLEGTVEGDVVGTGTCCLTETPLATWVRYDWRVCTARDWLTWLARWAAPLTRWNHDTIMQAGGRGLARHLASPGRPPAVTGG